MWEDFCFSSPQEPLGMCTKLCFCEQLGCPFYVERGWVSRTWRGTWHSPCWLHPACQSEPICKAVFGARDRVGKGKYIQTKECPWSIWKEAFSTILLVLSTRRKVQKLKKQPQPLWRRVLRIQHSDIIASICWTKDFIVSQNKTCFSFHFLLCDVSSKVSLQRSSLETWQRWFFWQAPSQISDWKGFQTVFLAYWAICKRSLFLVSWGWGTDANHWNSFLIFIDKLLPSLLVFSTGSNWTVLPSIMVFMSGRPNILDSQISSSRAIFCFFSLPPILDPSWIPSKVPVNSN